MLKSSYKPRLHNRIIMISIIVAAVSSVIYSVLLWTIVDGLEEAMFSTLVGHEIDEVVLDLAADKDAVLPHSGSLGVYLLSREDDQFIPDYLTSLESGSYREIANAGRKYFVAILDIYDDRLYMSFDITHLSSYSNALLLVLIGGGTLTIIIILIIGVWISRKVLLPVSTLAEEVAGINPNERQVRVEEKYRGYEVGLIAGSIDQFMNKMDEYVEREQSFTAAVSHELRTSIAVIFTSAELLEIGGGLEGAQKDTLARILTAAKYMRGVTEALLFFARSKGDQMDDTMPIISVKEVCEDLVSEYEIQANEKNLSLKLICRNNIMARMSETHLIIVVRNLLQNALNNTEAGGVLMVINENTLSISDTGRGIEGDNKEKIFDLCYHSPESSGSGLGLYLVMNICNFYGLDINLDTEFNKGSTFHVRFPELYFQEIKPVTEQA